MWIHHCDRNQFHCAHKSALLLFGFVCGDVVPGRPVHRLFMMTINHREIENLSQWRHRQGYPRNKGARWHAERHTRKCDSHIIGKYYVKSTISKTFSSSITFSLSITIFVFVIVKRSLPFYFHMMSREGLPQACLHLLCSVWWYKHFHHISLLILLHVKSTY